MRFAEEEVGRCEGTRVVSGVYGRYESVDVVHREGGKRVAATFFRFGKAAAQEGVGF